MISKRASIYVYTVLVYCGRQLRREAPSYSSLEWVDFISNLLLSLPQ